MITALLGQGSAARSLFPQLYRVRKLKKPLWVTTGRRVSREREPGDLIRRAVSFLRNGLLLGV